MLHKGLSRRHTRLERDGERIILIDLDSKNGTFVNETRISRCELRPGELFRCGEVRFELLPTIQPLFEPLTPTQFQSLQTRFSPGAIDELLEPHSDSTDGSALKLKRQGGEERAQEKLQVLLKVSQILSSPGSIEVLLERILELVFQILEVDQAAVLLVDPSTSRLVPRVAKVARGKPLPGSFYSQHIAEYMRTHRMAALFSDAQGDPRLRDAASVVLQSIQSSMCAPLKPRDEVLGVLYLDNRSRPHGFTQQDLEFFTAFANQAAIALENSVLAQRLEQEAVLRNTYARYFPPTTLKKLQLSRGAPWRRSIPVMAEIVFRHEGTLEKYIGDALMAVWGAPFAHPDDVDRAVRAAVEMQRALAGL